MPEQSDKAKQMIPTRLDPIKNEWLRDKATMRLMSAVNAQGGEARIVGGAVRNALLGTEVSDIDFAVNLPPEELIKALEKSEIKYSPTGLSHGTVTAIIEGKGFEITSLRLDKETDGRRAKVAFTDDWEADASRRDFTFNAIYADIEGNLYDYFDGMKDLSERKVRFIGKAESRIREDMLRILRFFRFQAWYGGDEIDAESLAACKKFAPLLPQLSVERVWKEIGKLLEAKAAAKTCVLMIKNDILRDILSEAYDYIRLVRLEEFEAGRFSPDKIRRLSALARINDAGLADKIAKRLRLSNKDAAKLKILPDIQGAFGTVIEGKKLRILIYEHGADNIRDALLLAAASGKISSPEEWLEIAREWKIPVFPIGGNDVIAMGVKSGARVGKILKIVEDWWKENDFVPDRNECLKAAENVV